MNIAGVWTIRLVPLAGEPLVRESGGVMVFDTGRILGGDTWSYYTGTYELQANLLLLRAKSSLHYDQDAESIFGGTLGEFSFSGKGLVDVAGTTIDTTLSVDDMPEVQLMARLTLAFKMPR